MGLSISGIGSGLDIDGIVTSLVEAEKTPQQKLLNLRESNIQTEISGLGSLKSALSEFQDSLADLMDMDTFGKRKVSLGSSDFFSATADSDAVATSYDIEVVQLAKAEKQSSAAFTDTSELGDAAVGSGSLTLGLGSESFTVTIDSSATTLADIRDAINNSEDNVGIKATLINDDTGTHLVLASEETGTSNTISVSVTDDDGNDADASGLSQLASGTWTVQQQAKDAIIEVDGMTVTRESNTIDDAIEGVTLTLKKANEVDETTSMAVSVNKDSVRKKLESFVESYNSLASLMSQMTSYDAESGSSPYFQGDSMMRTLDNQLHRALSNKVDGADSGLKSLAALGIVSNRDGELEIDDSVLSDQLESNFDAIDQLFASENGIANRLDETLKGYTQINGLLDTRTNNLEDAQTRVDDQRDRLDRKMEAYEARLLKQFTAMDSAIAELNSGYSYMVSQLTSSSS